MRIKMEQAGLRRVRKNFAKGEFFAKGLFFICAAFSVLAVFGIVIYLFGVSFPVFREVGLFNFLFKRVWQASIWSEYPDEISVQEAFGILPMIVSTLAITGGAVLWGGLFGVSSAVFAVYYCPKKLKGVYRQLIDLLAGIPSVVYGFVGLSALVPILQAIFKVNVGTGPLAAALVLALMITPTISSVCQNSLSALPKEFFEGALAIGNTKEQAVFGVCVPSAKKGILSAIILGIGRAAGETMAVQMVVGNSINKFPKGLFQGVCTLTTHIVNDMPYSADGLWRNSLVAVGFVLLCFILVINLILAAVKSPSREGTSRKGKRVMTGAGLRSPQFFKRGRVPMCLKYACVAAAYLIVVLLGGMVGFILVKGLPNLTANFVFGQSSNANPTLKSAFITTILTVIATMGIALPVGIGGAIYLNEYAARGGRVLKIVHLFTDTLSGIPSIVFGLFGMVFFVKIFGGRCILAGALTMSLIILPTVIRTTEEALREVPVGMREASLALGASKARTIFKIVLPSAIGGIVTSAILGIGRIVGESAALIYTAGATFPVPSGYLDTGATFAVMMYTLSSAGKTDVFGQTSMGKTYATAAVLLVFVGSINWLVSLIKKRKA